MMPIDRAPRTVTQIGLTMEEQLRNSIPENAASTIQSGTRSTPGSLCKYYAVSSLKVYGRKDGLACRT